MGTTPHSTLTGADLHEPKGAAASTLGTSPVSDGAGSSPFAAPAMNRLANGATFNSTDVTVASDGATSTLTLAKSGGGASIIVYFDSLPVTFLTPVNATLTSGTDAVPVLNYVYILESTGLITVSTVGWPTAQHAPVATVFCQSAASLQTDGAMKMHKWNDKLGDSSDQGHITHINRWIRSQHATWESGCDLTAAVVIEGAAVDGLSVSTLVGSILQLHAHTMPVRDTLTDPAWAVGGPVDQYTRITNLNEIDTDSASGALTGNNTYYSLVIWGVVSEAEADCKIMVNVPGGSYGSTAAAVADASNFDLYTVCSNFRGTGFLIARVTLRYQTADSGTITVEATEDLRGIQPFIAR